MGLIVASFIFAALAQTMNEIRLLGCGMLIWGAGVLGTGLSEAYGPIILSRVRKIGGLLQRQRAGGWGGSMRIIC